MSGNYSTREFREKLYDDLHVRLRDTKSCQVPTCPYIAERLASGALEYRDLILECLGRNLRLRLYHRCAVTGVRGNGNGRCRSYGEHCCCNCGQLPHDGTRF